MLILSEKVRPDLVAILTTIALGLAQILTPQEAFSGFSRSTVITILAIFVLAEGLQKTGVTDMVGETLLRVAGPREGWLVAVVAFTGALLSLFMNNIAAAVVLLPAVNGVTRKTGISPSRLMMPLAFGTILGGMATLLTSTNLVVSSLLLDQGLKGFGLLDFLPLGIPIVLVGCLYLVLFGQRVLKSGAAATQISAGPLHETNLSDIYHLNERLVWAYIPATSPLVNRPLSESCLRETYRLHVLGIKRKQQMSFMPTPNFILRPGDYLWVAVHPEDRDMEGLDEILQFSDRPEKASGQLEEQDYALVEAVLTPRSHLIGRTLSETNFRQKYGMEVIAVWRSGRPYRTRLSTLPLQFGDALLLFGRHAQIDVLHTEEDLILLNGTRPPAAHRGPKTWLAVGLMYSAIIAGSLNNAIIGEVMLGAALVMVLTGIMSMDQAYQAIEWKTIFLIAGMLPLGIAMTKTGAAAIIGDWLIVHLGSLGPLAILAGLVVTATLMAQAVHGAAVSAIMAPVAIQIAGQIHVDPRTLAMGIALATSLTFMTPLGHPVNILVMGPGGYHFKDFFRLGAPLTVLLLILIIGLLPVVWGF